MNKKKVIELISDAIYQLDPFCMDIDNYDDLCKNATKILYSAKEELNKPSLEDYFNILPLLTLEKDKNNNYTFVATNAGVCKSTPTLYKDEGHWVVDWLDIDGNSLKYVDGDIPLKAVKNAYDWCVKEGLIKDILNYEQ